MSDINVQTFSGKVNITSNLLVGSSHLFVDTTNNRVGLITTTPDAGLHVNSNAYVHTDFRVGSEIVMNDTTGRITAGSFVGDGSAMTGINSDSGSWVNGTNSNVHLATSTDKVGIGTTDPGRPLDVQFTGDTGIRAKNTGSTHASVYIDSASGYSYLRFQSSGAEKFWLQSTPTGDLAFRPSGSGHVMDIKNNGNVGIGKTDPGEKLHVGGNIGTTWSDGRRIIMNYDDSYRQGLVLDASTRTMTLFSTTNDSGGAIAFKTRGGSGSSDTDYGTERMRILKNGNVGIGATIPDVKFQVEGTSSSHQKLTKLATWNIFHHRDDSGFEHLITYGGSDGQAYFDNRDNFMYVQIPAFSGETLYTSTVSGYNSGYFNARFRDLNGNKPNLAQNTTYKVHAYSSRIDAFGTITTAGNVGIGKTDPTYSLDVSGNLRVTTGILDTSWCSGSWLQTCTQSPTVTVYSNNGGGPMSTPGHGGTGMGGNRGRFTARKAGNYLISCCAVHMGRGGADASGTNLLVVFDAVGTNWNLNNVINTYDEIIDLRVAPTAEEAYTFTCQVYMNVGHYFSFRVHSSGYIDNNAKLLCSAALVR